MWLKQMLIPKLARKLRKNVDLVKRINVMKYNRILIVSKLSMVLKLKLKRRRSTGFYMHLPKIRNWITFAVALEH